MRRRNGDRVMVEVRLIIDGVQVERTWNYREFLEGSAPSMSRVVPQPWMREPRKSWVSPQDPIIMSALVDAEHETEARAWLAGL